MQFHLRDSGQVSFTRNSAQLCAGVFTSQVPGCRCQTVSCKKGVGGQGAPVRLIDINALPCMPGPDLQARFAFIPGTVSRCAWLLSPAHALPVAWPGRDTLASRFFDDGWPLQGGVLIAGLRLYRVFGIMVATPAQAL